MNPLRSLVRAAVLFLALAAAAWSASAADKLKLKDGRVLEGVVVREVDGGVFFRVKVGSIESQQFYAKADIAEIVRDKAAEGAAPAAPAGGTTPAPASPNSTETGTPIPDGAIGVTFVSLEEMVGPYMNARALLDSVELLKQKLPKEQRPKVLVLVFESGGGALLEVEPLSNAIHEKLKKDFRVVAWIRSAISAAAMTAMNCEEIYMMSEGNIGGAVAYSMVGPGQAKAADGANLEGILKMGQMLADRGKHPREIILSMQTLEPLSANIDDDGHVSFFNSETEGKYLINRKGYNLTFNALDAVKYKLAEGIADTKDQLMTRLGYKEWVEVGQFVDKDQIRFRQAVKTISARVQELYSKMNLAVGEAQSASSREDREKQVGRARNFLRELRELARQAPSVEKYGAGGSPPLTREFFDRMDRDLRRILNPDAR
ncbi:MAG: hypothetical protein IBJ11_05730 [Phycisphaerales bacterium]|nr:hypothetical protein [Phycisphaerales bacterium]